MHDILILFLACTLMLLTFFSLLTGCGSGLVMGLFGGGSGLVLVPSMVILTKWQQLLPNDYIMRYAVGTTFAVTSLFAIFTVYLQHRRRAILWKVFFNLLPGIILGIVIGNLFSGLIPNRIMEIIFGIASLLLAVWFYRYTPPQLQENRLPGNLGLFLAGLFFGVVCGVLAIAPFTVPYLRRCGVEMRKAIATSTTCGLLMALIGTVTVIFAGQHMNQQIPHTFGYIYLPFVIPLTIGCIIFSHLGVKLAHSLSSKTLKTLYSILLIIVGCKMLFH